MRSFDDSEGGHWDAALLSASYGDIRILFSRTNDSTLLSHPFEADNLAEAEAKLTQLPDDDLRSLLAAAQLWDPGTQSL